jgi:hypothetical protein
MAKKTKTIKTTKTTKTTKKPKQDELDFIEVVTEDDKRIAEIYIKMKEYYGNNLANFEHQPRVFAHQYRMFQYYRPRGYSPQGAGQ